jgi:hypothetical protein
LAWLGSESRARNSTDYGSSEAGAFDAAILLHCSAQPNILHHSLDIVRSASTRHKVSPRYVKLDRIVHLLSKL